MEFSIKVGEEILQCKVLMRLCLLSESQYTVERKHAQTARITYAASKYVLYIYQTDERDFLRALKRKWCNDFITPCYPEFIDRKPRL